MIKKLSKYSALPVLVILFFIGATFAFKGEQIFKNISIAGFIYVFMNKSHLKINNVIMSDSNVFVDLDINTDVIQTLYCEMPDRYSIDFNFHL